MNATMLNLVNNEFVISYYVMDSSLKQLLSLINHKQAKTQDAIVSPIEHPQDIPEQILTKQSDMDKRVQAILLQTGKAILDAMKHLAQRKWKEKVEVRFLPKRYHE
jgi:hypothetical protein